MTEDGAKVPDVAWCSEAFLAQHWSEVALLKAPEIVSKLCRPRIPKRNCVIRAARYLSLGAREVWLVAEDGAVEIHTTVGLRDDSTFGFNPAAADQAK